MAKRKRKTQTAEEVVEKQAKKEPKLTRAAFQITLWVILLGLAAQVIMAIAVYPSLPDTISGGWVGLSEPQKAVPSWLVFLVFPGAQLVLLILAIFSPKDEQGRLVMESGKAWTLVLVSLLFTVLQASAFYMSKR